MGSCHLHIEQRGSGMKCLIFIGCLTVRFGLLACPIANAWNRTGQIGQFGPETAN